MFERLKSFLGSSSVELGAATQLAPVAPLKVKPGQRSWPAFFTTTKSSTEKIQRPDRRLINSDVTSYRNGTTTLQVIRDMVASSPELSNAVYTAVRLGVPAKYVAMARNMDGTINPEATNLLQQIITRFDVIGDPLEGYVGGSSIKSVSETLAKDLAMYGQAACELVLDKARMPYRLQPISSTVIEFRYENNGVRPFQKVGDVEVDLDVPTVALIQLDSDGISAYSTSPIEPALRAVLFSETFIQDLHRVMKKAIHPRVKISVKEEQVRKYLSPEAQVDPSKAAAELNTIISQIESKINNLEPSDAIVYLDSLGMEVDVPADATNYETLHQISNARLASGSKTLPSILGLESGSSSSNIASTQVSLYVQSVDSSIRQKLNEIYSRLFTMAIRLTGADCYATFEYDEISIRPRSELVAFEQTREGMVLEKLSLGMLTDEEASLMLTGKLPPAGYKPLSGTMFRSKGVQKSDETSDESSNSGSTMNQKIKSDAPAVGRGQNKDKNNKKAEDDALEPEAGIPATVEKPTFVTPDITVNIDNTQKSASILKMRRDEDGNLTIERVEEGAQRVG